MCAFENGWVDGTERSKEVQQVTQVANMIMVWWVWRNISPKCITGPFVFDSESVTGENYQELLLKFLSQALGLAPRPDFLTGLCSFHSVFSVRQYLDKWLEAVGLTGVSCCSDITLSRPKPLDFLLYGYIKNRVFAKPSDYHFRTKDKDSGVYCFNFRNCFSNRCDKHRIMFALTMAPNHSPISHII